MTNVFTHMFQVESIVDSLEKDGEVLYKVRWKGYTAKDDSWLSAKDMHCPKLIQRYERTLKDLAEKDEWVVSSAGCLLYQG